MLVVRIKDTEIKNCSVCMYCTDNYIFVDGQKVHYCFIKSDLVCANSNVCKEFDEENYK